MMQLSFGTTQFGCISTLLNSIDQQNFPESQTHDDIYMGEISQGVQSMEMMSYFSYFWPAVSAI